jgi:hypothetical protein
MNKIVFNHRTLYSYISTGSTASGVRYVTPIFKPIREKLYSFYWRKILVTTVTIIFLRNSKETLEAGSEVSISQTILKELKFYLSLNLLA